MHIEADPTAVIFLKPRKLRIEWLSGRDMELDSVRAWDLSSDESHLFLDPYFTS